MMELKAKLVALQPQVRFFPSRHPPLKQQHMPSSSSTNSPFPLPLPPSPQISLARERQDVAKARGGRIAAEWFR